MYVYFLRSRIASLTDRILKVSFRFLAVSGATLEKKEKAIKKEEIQKKAQRWKRANNWGSRDQEDYDLIPADMQVMPLNSIPLIL